MKLDDLVLTICAVLAVLVAAVYFIGLIFGVIQTGGLLLPVLMGFIVIAVIFGVVIRQRLSSDEDDHYEEIER
ncbi:MAG: hypothetical protein AAF557_04960 [Pseudomonadota bacterium]